MTKKTTSQIVEKVDPPRIRVKDLSWPLRVLVALAGVAGAILILYFILAVAYLLAAL